MALCFRVRSEVRGRRLVRRQHLFSSLLFFFFLLFCVSFSPSTPTLLCIGFVSFCFLSLLLFSCSSDVRSPSPSFSSQVLALSPCSPASSFALVRIFLSWSLPLLIPPQPGVRKVSEAPLAPVAVGASGSGPPHAASGTGGRAKYLGGKKQIQLFFLLLRRNNAFFILPHCLILARSSPRASSSLPSRPELCVRRAPRSSWRSFVRQEGEAAREGLPQDPAKGRGRRAGNRQASRQADRPRRGREAGPPRAVAGREGVHVMAREALRRPPPALEATRASA